MLAGCLPSMGALMLAGYLSSMEAFTPSMRFAVGGPSCFRAERAADAFKQGLVIYFLASDMEQEPVQSVRFLVRPNGCVLRVPLICGFQAGTKRKLIFFSGGGSIEKRHPPNELVKAAW